MGTRVAFAAAVKVSRHPALLRRLMAAIGAEEALVTDESHLWDFLPLGTHEERKRKLGDPARHRIRDRCWSRRRRGDRGGHRHA